MRLAIVDTTLTTPPTGGCQTFLEHLAPTLRSRGHDVSILTQPGGEPAVADRLLKAGVRVLDNIWPRRFLPEERAGCLARWCMRERIEAYVVSVSGDVGWLAVPHLVSGIRTAAVVHADGPAFYSPLAHYRDFIDRAIGVSRETCRKITAVCGLPESRTLHIPYGVERAPEAHLAERFREGGGRHRLEVGYVGRLVHTQKRVLDLTPIVHELAERKLPFLMHVIGSGDDAERLRSELDAAGVADHVRWWGWLKPAEVRERLTQLDALVLPSESEGLPLALIEAMAHAVVPVASRIPSGNSELVADGENGFLVAVGDIMAFADRLEQLIRDPRLKVRLARAAWLTSGDYSIGRMVSAYEACFARNDERAPHPSGPFPVMPSCRSAYPLWARKAKWRLVALLRGAARSG